MEYIPLYVNAIAVSQERKQFSGKAAGLEIYSVAAYVPITPQVPWHFMRCIL
jgi:hypothetical protein